MSFQPIYTTRDFLPKVNKESQDSIFIGNNGLISVYKIDEDAEPSKENLLKSPYNFNFRWFGIQTDYFQTDKIPSNVEIEIESIGIIQNDDSDSEEEEDDEDDVDEDESVSSKILLSDIDNTYEDLYNINYTVHQYQFLPISKFLSENKCAIDILIDTKPDPKFLVFREICKLNTFKLSTFLDNPKYLNIIENSMDYSQILSENEYAVQLLEKYPELICPIFICGNKNAINLIKEYGCYRDEWKPKYFEKYVQKYSDWEHIFSNMKNNALCFLFENKNGEDIILDLMNIDTTIEDENYEDENIKYDVFDSIRLADICPDLLVKILRNFTTQELQKINWVNLLKFTSNRSNNECLYQFIKKLVYGPRKINQLQNLDIWYTNAMYMVRKNDMSEMINPKNDTCNYFELWRSIAKNEYGFKIFEDHIRTINQRYADMCLKNNSMFQGPRFLLTEFLHIGCAYEYIKELMPFLSLSFIPDQEILKNPNSKVFQMVLEKFNKEEDIINLCELIYDNPANEAQVDFIIEHMDVIKTIRYYEEMPVLFWVNIATHTETYNRKIYDHYKDIVFEHIHLILRNFEFKTIYETKWFIDFVEDNIKSIHQINTYKFWNPLYESQYMCKLDYHKMRNQCMPFAEDLAAFVFHPERLMRFSEKYQIDITELNEIY